MSYVTLVSLTQAQFNTLKTAATPLDRPVAFFITDAAPGAPNIVFGRQGQTATTAQTSGAVAAGSSSASGILNNFAATVAPTANDDSADGYAVGSRWVDVTGAESYICLSAAVGAAVWSNATVGTITEVAGLTAALAGKQATLVSGTHVKTVNGASVVGSGNITVAADLPGGAATTVTNEGMATTGAPTVDTTTAPGETIVIFTGSGSFTPPNGVTTIPRILGVAGGGAGGKDHAGGGAGGFASELTNQAVTQQSYAVTIGGGGIAMTTDVASSAAVHSGQATSIGALFTWQGGGAGGGRIQATSGDGAAALSGGPGGGGGGTGTGTTAGTNPRGAAAGSQGFPGGNGNNHSSNAGHGGGGGGAGGPGGNSTASSSGGASDGKSGDGGIGILSNITGTSVGYGGGGAGGRWVNGATAANLGTNLPGGVDYGGGPGEGATAASNQNGLANRGGGGGGGGDSGKSGGNGGAGFLVIRFPTQTRSYQALQAFANDAAAATGGILVGQFYRDSSTSATRQRVS